MTIQPAGIHHVTAVASDPQANADFYLSALGMRMVKRTVNFDSPDTYHFYYGDSAGHPGTIMTFFPWPGAPKGRHGAGQATTTAFSVPEGSIGWWETHLAKRGVETTRPAERMEEDVLALRDPDGLFIELVASPDHHDTDPWDGGGVPAEHAVRGIRSVTLTEHDLDRTARMLGDHLNFRLHAEEGNRYRFRTAAAGTAVGTVVDVVADPRAPRGLVAAGTVHHVAYRAPDADAQVAWRTELANLGIGVTEVRDRQYFQSIYFREPGGVLLEIATDGPGFDYDEPLLELGRALRLPPWLEPQRSDIERALPSIKTEG
ncbi:ring-cleaving dioxygenase [Spiractinospora alimapuensis]|uniref:ring-cleaving dioxygenase n=1 Tax=Spiractinospora alimapuensis TaxID=2820884 RepID=UPI001F21D01B|nr:ring-cleaving dioxygenase [Spiractinospora alimapuensis]QVQ52131.1 ring-cleaving dioxygenase [Spiractinospora alimapuensis]